MSRILNQETRSAIYARESDKDLFLLLTLSHPDMDGDLCLTDASYEELSTGARGVISRGVEYLCVPLEVILDNEDEEQPPRITCRIDNINQELTKTIREIQSPPDVLIENVLSSDPDTVVRSAEGFKLESVGFDVYAVEGELTTEDFDSEPFPSGRFSPADFTSL